MQTAAARRRLKDELIIHRLVFFTPFVSTSIPGCTPYSSPLQSRESRTGATFGPLDHQHVCEPKPARGCGGAGCKGNASQNHWETPDVETTRVTGFWKFPIFGEETPSWLLVLMLVDLQRSNLRRRASTPACPAARLRRGGVVEHPDGELLARLLRMRPVRGGESVQPGGPTRNRA